jgi:glycosyltransferase involved in cell wall biosynthesis
LLSRLLDALLAQSVSAAFSFDVTVVDNDPERSSQGVVEACAGRSAIAVSYYSEPVRNISRARNRAVQCATGNLIAFIDDDECPVSDWLMRLQRVMKTHKADGVFAPVVPEYPPAAPDWLKRSGLLDRRRHPTGTVIPVADARTGNVLLARSLFEDGRMWFDPALGRTGGEDSDFFARIFKQGRVFVWCDEAVAHETVPPDRWRARFHVRRLWRAGTLHGEWMRQGRRAVGITLVKNTVILVGCIVASIPAMALPKHLRVPVVQKLAYCTGMITAFFGMSLLRDRE